MAWVPSDKEIDAVLRLDGPERYSYFVKKVADRGLVCGFWQDGWALMGDEKGEDLAPVWPHQKYAAPCAKDAWAGYEPKSIPLEEWLERWVPGLRRDGRMVAVFPTPDGHGLAVEPERLASDIRPGTSALALGDRRIAGCAARRARRPERRGDGRRAPREAGSRPRSSPLISGVGRRPRDGDAGLRGNAFHRFRRRSGDSSRGTATDQGCFVFVIARRDSQAMCELGSSTRVAQSSQDHHPLSHISTHS